jgi:mevalonate kinase
VNLPACGRAAGKVILLGEHAVVYGRPALAAGLQLGLVAEVRAGSGPARIETDRPALAADGKLDRLLAEAAAAIGLEPRGLVVRVGSQLPAGVGLGSSAALAVAVLRALAAASGRTLDTAEELRLGRRLEAIFHGHPSGIDPAAAALGTCFRFVRGEPPTVTPLRLPGALPLVIAFGERARSTGAAVTALRARWEADRPRHERLFDDIGAVVEQGMRAVEQGDLTALGHAFDENQTLLERLGVSETGAEALITVARRSGALGAKLTGGGAGGAIVALASDAPRVAAALEGAGARTLVVQVGPPAEQAA